MFRVLGAKGRHGMRSPRKLRETESENQRGRARGTCAQPTVRHIPASFLPHLLFSFLSLFFLGKSLPINLFPFFRPKKYNIFFHSDKKQSTFFHPKKETEYHCEWSIAHYVGVPIGSKLPCCHIYIIITP